MSQDEVARIIRLDKRKQQRAAERIRRHHAQGRWIDQMMEDAIELIRHG